MPNTYHPSSRLTVHHNQPYHIVNTEPVTLTTKANTMMTVPCTLPRSGNSLFEMLKQHFVKQPSQYTPVIINAENETLPIHFTVTMKLLHPSKVMSEPWRKSKNQTKI